MPKQQRPNNQRPNNPGPSNRRPTTRFTPRPKEQRIDPRVVDRALAEKAAAEKASAQRAAAARAGGKSGRSSGAKSKAVAVRPATLGTWIAGARLPTLLLAISPVVLGTGLASMLTDNWWDHWVRASLALVVALGLQIGVNYANDYSDGIRGVDADRVGPARLVGSGRAKPRTVLVVALLFFGIASLAGIVLIVLSQQWWLFAVGALALVAAWFYTGGKRPYGYLALGEVVSFLFFGVAAVAGTMLTQVGQVNADGWFGGVALGCFVAAVMLVNNLRDREKDALHGKRTLAVRLGNVGSRVLYVILMLVPFAILWLFGQLYDKSFYVYFVAVAAIPAIIVVIFARSAREYVIPLRLTLLTSLFYGVGLAAAVIFVA
ncbi:MAG TPA: 1,4-dihydroxy-2-naphthoate polyprenyltransferase [Pseudolysinimonas sp.]|nr:1,4-dihydroxy-2-naphthoate polyprenyltransferase [Pseudolysinimonas sp.]